MDQRTGLPKISVLITVYNGEDFVGETIEAVLAQSHPPAEILVIDDGSTDRTPGLVRNFAGKVTLHSRPNLGVSEARNYGLSIASSEWVAMLDHDDLWEPGHLEGLAHAIARDPFHTPSRNRIMAHMPPYGYRVDRQ
jgi:glycosyltransferase involved in cell wall biosynthesis